MGDVDLNEINNEDENKWISSILEIMHGAPTPLKYLFIFATTAFAGSAAAYYVNPTGLLCGALAVIIYYQAEQK